MLGKIMTGVGVGVLIVAGLVGHGHAFSEPIPTKISLLKWGGNPRVGKLYKLVSKAPKESPFSLPADPVLLGGSVEVKVGAGTLSCTLAAGAFAGSQGWKALGNPAGSKGYKYLNKDALLNEPCKVVIIKEKVIKVLAKGVGSIALPLGPGLNPDVQMFLVAGADQYCASAVGPHFKEKAGTLIKMKSQDPPDSCARCGDDAVNRPNEECDGADDSVCPGSCVLPGGGGGTCGDDVRNGGDECTCATEECDGADSDLCSGLCLRNCTCPEPICNNGVKEVGEACDPAGSTADCAPGDVCGGFCTCVPDVPCNCGSPDPTLYKFTTKAPVEASCGTTDGGPPIDNVECMALYIGGGEGAQPVPIGVGDESTTKYNIAQCAGTDLTLAHTTPAEVGPLHCSEGKRCSASSDNAGDPCLRDRQCPGGACEPLCFFLAPLPIFSIDLPQLGSCILNQVAGDALGGLNCETSESFLRQPIDTRIHLTLSDQSPTTPGYQPCPVCLGGDLWVPDSGTCEGGPNDGQSCTPQSTTYDTHDCCAGGQNNTKPCLDDSDCPGATCVPGCTGYPTSHDCPPHPLSDIAGIYWVMELSPSATTKVADESGNFCGWCRDVLVEGSGCFEGDSDEGPPGGAQGCPDSAIIACRPATFHGLGGGDPADVSECGDALTCRTDLDCRAPYETCEQRSPGAWRDATVRQITVHGVLPADPDLRDKLPHRGALGASFCIPPTFVPAIENQADVGGPGGFSLEGNHQLSPSGALLDLTPELLD